MRPGTEPNGISSASDGTVYLAVPPFIARISPKGTIDAADRDATAEDGSPRSVVALPDGAIVTASEGQLLRIAPDRQPTALAGVKRSLRSLTEPVPTDEPAATARFTRYLAPIGVLGDGSIIVADGDALWSLRSGNLTRIYQLSEAKSGADQPSAIGAGAAVSPDGTVYLLPERPKATLKESTIVSPTGSTAGLELPAAVDGVPGSPGDLTPLWLTSDGGSGVYVHASHTGDSGTTDGEFVLHVHGGKAELIAASHTQGTPVSCSATKPTDARKFPCPFPWAITYQPGRLVMAGGEPYVVVVPLPKH